MATIERKQPTKEGHPLVSSHVLRDVTAENGRKHGVIPMFDYLVGHAGRSRADLNPHDEGYIVQEGDSLRKVTLADLNELLSEKGVNVSVVGLDYKGNNNQKLTSVVQGVNEEKPNSGYERPTISEGPHMILAPYAIDDNGELHVFRAIQIRTGQAMLDTQRGFADAETLASGEQMYNVEGAAVNVTKNMQRIVGEETGDALQIKKIAFLGAPRVNSSFVTSQSAIFGVEVDYNKFVESQKVIGPEELKRRKEQFDHEGLVGGVIDMTLMQYLAYKEDSDISKDMAADFGTDTVVIGFLAQELATVKKEHADSQAKLVRREQVEANLSYFGRRALRRAERRTS